MTEVTDLDDYLPVFEEVGGRKDVISVIELGVREGHSTRAWLRGLHGHGHLWSVDLALPSPDVVPPEHLDAWTMVVGDDCSDDVLAQLPHRVDAVFIDTDHDEMHTRNELTLYGARVRPGGCILLHDTANEHPEHHGERIGKQQPFPVLRAAQWYAQRRRAVLKTDDRGWGLGWLVMP